MTTDNETAIETETVTNGTPEEVSQETKNAAEAVFILARFFERPSQASDRAATIALALNDRAKVLDFYALVIQANQPRWTNKEARKLARNAFESIAKHEGKRFGEMLDQLQAQISPVAVVTPKIEIVQ